MVYPDTADLLSQDADDAWTFTTDNGDHVSFTYDRMGRQTSRTDQNGSVHSFSYIGPGDPGAGRLEAETITTLGTGVDGTVRRIGTAYDDRGRRTTVTSYSDTAGTTAVNQVATTHGDWGQVTTSEQEHAGTVDASTPAVQYGFDDGAGAGTDAKFLRQTQLTYPDGRQVDYTYAAGDWDHGKLGLVETIELDGTAAPDPTTSYQYLGGGTLLSETHAEPDVMRSAIGSDLDRLDRFGRVIDHRWTNAAETATFDRFTYGHDPAGNRTYKENAQTTGHDKLYSYDGLHRLDDVERGDLNAGKDSISTLAFHQNWGLDVLGNWRSFDEDADGDATWDLEQSRTHSEANEIDGIDETTGSSWTTPSHDANGNMTSLPQPDSPTSSYTATYDAWNRLVKLEDGTDTVAEYEYDGLGRRVVNKTYVSGVLDETRHFYYSTSWQVLEERVDGTADTDVAIQYLWGQRYVDDLIARDRDTTGNGTLDERLYALQDANFNVTAIVDDTGSVVERYRYTPYGERTVLDDDWTDDADGESDYGFAIGHQGLLHDEVTGLVYNRARYLHVRLGRFIQRDPLGYPDGMNRYAAYHVVRGGVDPQGLSVTADATLYYGFSHAIKYKEINTWTAEGRKWIFDRRIDVKLWDWRITAELVGSNPRRRDNGRLEFDDPPAPSIEGYIAEHHQTNDWEWYWWDRIEIEEHEANAGQIDTNTHFVMTRWKPLGDEIDLEEWSKSPEGDACVQCLFMYADARVIRIAVNSQA